VAVDLSNLEIKGEAYEPSSGRWSRVMAPLFLDWLNSSSRGHWIDIGCGTGALIEAILASASPAEVVGIDPSSAFIAYARRHIHDPRVRMEVGTAQSLPVASNQYDAVVSGLVLHHIQSQDRLAAMREFVRVARPGGSVGAYIWDYSSTMELRVKFWESAALETEVPENIDERTRYPVSNASPLTTLFRQAGLNAVETELLQIDASFKNFDDYWLPFRGGYGVASQFLLSQPAEVQELIRERLRLSLPITPDGSFTLRAAAWAVKGVN
jgi:ubiquinone/menaquinone biosynthesis C-methylase UbiE